MSDKIGQTDTSPEDAEGQTRRDTLLSLGGVTVGAAIYGYGVRPLTTNAGNEGDEPDASVSSDHVETMTALAEAVYPTAVSIDESYIANRVFGRTEPQPGHMDEVYASLDNLEDYARARFGDPIPALSPKRRRAVLRSMGVTESHPKPDGTLAERVRFYVLNDLIYVLFTSPISSDLTGIENPPGHPGGREAYRRAPNGGENQ